MKFEVRKKVYGEERVFFQTMIKEDMPPPEQIAAMELAGYNAYLDGKRYSGEKKRGRPRRDA